MSQDDKKGEPSLALRLAMLAASMETTILETNCAVFIEGTPPLRTQIAWIREAVVALESAPSAGLAQEEGLRPCGCTLDAKGAQVDICGFHIGERMTRAERAAASSELARLREFQRKIEEAEARCCPEDVGFEEWIGVLKRQVGERDVQIGTMTAAINAMNQAPNSASRSTEADDKLGMDTRRGGD